MESVEDVAHRWSVWMEADSQTEVIVGMRVRMPYIIEDCATYIE